MRKSLSVLFMGLIISTPSFAQEVPMNLPVQPVSPKPVLQTPATHKSEVGANLKRLAAPRTPVASSREVSEQSLQRDISKTRRARGVRPPPTTLTVHSGRNVVFGVALHQINRLVTPFAHPVIKTTSSAQITGDGEDGIVYIATNDQAPIGLFIYDRDTPAQAISLTLVPSNIPPISVRLTLAGYQRREADRAVRVSGDHFVAEQWETGQPFVTTLKGLFQDLANGAVPDGYSLELVKHNPPPVLCSIPGVELIARQVLTGSSIRVVVYKATNHTGRVFDVDLSHCNSSATLASAAWPKYRLLPGDATEVYVAVRKSAGQEPKNARPSVIGGGL